MTSRGERAPRPSSGLWGPPRWAGVRLEVNLLQRLAGREARRPDASFTAVGFTGGHFTLQTGCEELLVGPGLGAGTLGETLDGLTQGRRLQSPGQIRQLGSYIPT